MKNIEKDKIHFIFDSRSFEPEYRSSNLHTFLECITDNIEIPWTDNFDIPYDIVLHTCKFEEFNSDTVSISENPNDRFCFVLPWMKAWLENDAEHRVAIEKINNLDDHWENVCILADYSHESHLPGPMGAPVLSSRPWIECNRYICCIHSIGHSNLSGRSSAFKSIVSTWSYTSAVLLHMLSNKRITDTFTRGIPEHKHVNIKYLIPNRLGRRHRRDFIVAMDEANELQHAEWSMVIPDDQMNPTRPLYDVYTDKFGINPRAMSRPWDKWSTMDPGESPNQLVPTDLIDQCKIYVATDTWADYTDCGTTKLNTPQNSDEPFWCYDVSEKIVKAYLYGMPGFLLARPGSVERLRELGFWMPGGDYNDEGYSRDLIAKLVTALKSFNMEQHEMQEHLINNRDLIKSKKLHFNLSREIMDEVTLWTKIA